MESLVTEAGFVVDDDLLNFSLEGVCEEEPSNPAAAAAAATALCRAAHTGSFPEFVEEELEWLSNKDAFPAVETCFGILSDNPGLILNHQSPVSVLENSNSSISAGSNGSGGNGGGNGGSSGGSIASCCNSIKVPTKYPVRARSKRRRKRRTGFTDLPSQQQCVWMNQVNVVVKNKKQESQLSLPPLPSAAAATADSGGGGGTPGGGMGRRCWHCQADKTPQWRAGPMGPKTLCNACGVRYKSGRLLPEYRPANSPTFSSNLHSNSHRKVVEMRRQKQAVVVPGDGIEVNVSCGYFG